MSQDSDAQVSVDSDTDVAAGDGTVVPPLLLITLGLPLFLTIAWFFMRFTSADRFGGVVVPKREDGEE
ncbi:MAG: hypothetical protein AB8H79_11450 [Myxococcota bacterium]